MMRSGRRSGARIFCSDSSPQGHVRHKAGNAHSHPQRKAHVEAIARAPGLSAEVSQEFEQICQQMHVELTAQSSHGKRIVAEKSGHSIPNKLTNGRCSAMNGRGVSFWHHTGDKGHMTEKRMQSML